MGLPPRRPAMTGPARASQTRLVRAQNRRVRQPAARVPMIRRAQKRRADGTGMNDQVTEDPQTILDRIERQSVRQETPCGDGSMVWRLWNDTGDGNAPLVVLFHGGAGSWRHWVRTIPALARHYRVLVPDLPGLGDSAYPPVSDDAASVATVVAAGLDAVVGAD